MCVFGIDVVTRENRERAGDPRRVAVSQRLSLQRFRDGSGAGAPDSPGGRLEGCDGRTEKRSAEERPHDYTLEEKRYLRKCTE